MQDKINIDQIKKLQKVTLKNKEQKIDLEAYKQNALGNLSAFSVKMEQATKLILQ